MINVFILVALVSTAQSSQSESLLFGIPPQIRRCLEPVESHYKPSDRSNPFYLRGDIDGDGKLDYAVLITNSRSERGVAVCLAATRKPIILGAGSVFDGDSDLTFGVWRIFPKGPVGRGVEAGPPPILRGDALLLIWPESASGLVYWDGRGFRWYQQGD